MHPNPAKLHVENLGARRLERVETAGGAIGYRSPSLTELGVPHVFTTRCGEGGAVWDLTELGVEGALRLHSAAGSPSTGAVRELRQVHGARVLEASGDACAQVLEADGVVTEQAGGLVLVRTADCVPVLLARADGQRVAAVHAGWRGIVAGVLESALARLGPGEFVAAIGACICGDCFEVGEEVAEAFREVGLGASVRAPEAGKARVDLPAAVQARLELGGVTRIDRTDRCTYEHGAEFFSHRRDVSHDRRPRTGRMGAAIGVGR